MKPSLPAALAPILLVTCLIAGCGDANPSRSGEDAVEARGPDRGGETAGDADESHAVGSAGASPIDRERLLAHVRVLASDDYDGREAGTDGGRKAAAYVRDQLRGAGVEACGDSLVAPFGGAPGSGVEQHAYRNVVGRVTGTVHPDRFIVVTAHYDHLGRRRGEVYNGADDNASGTAALIEMARFFVRHPVGHTLIFAALDAEEKGLRGARAFLESECARTGEIIQNVNLDMVSRSVARELYASGTYHHPEFIPVLDTLDATTGIDLLFGHDEPGTGPDDWTMASDHGPFHAADIPFVYFGVEDHPGYHRPSDDFGDITPDFFHDAATLILRAVRAIDRHHVGATSP